MRKRFFLHHFSFCFLVFTYILYPPLRIIDSDPFVQLEMLNSTKIFFGFVSQEGSPRQTRIMNWWLSALRGHEYAFIVNKTSKQNRNYKSIDIDHKLFKIVNDSKKYYGADNDRALKRITGMKYFLYNTTCDYYWTLTDDIAIDLHGLNNVIKDLERQYDPNKDNVMMGQSHWKFIQGGTGILLSRKAAKIINERSLEWLLRVSRYDDVETDKWRVYLGLSIPETYSPYMFGEEPSIFINDTFYKNEYPKCEQTYYPYSPIYKLTNLIALHSRGPYANKAMNNLVNAKRFMHDMYFYYKRFKILLCKDSPY